MNYASVEAARNTKNVVSSKDVILLLNPILFQ